MTATATAKLEVLVGPIASGKSTYAMQRAREGALVVSDDAIVTAVHGGDYTLYDRALKPLYKLIEHAIVHAAAVAGKDVVIDRALDVSPESRRRWVALARSLDMHCEAVVFPNEGPEVHARRRAASGGRGRGYDDWLKVAVRHQRGYLKPSIAEGFDKVIERLS